MEILCIDFCYNFILNSFIFAILDYSVLYTANVYKPCQQTKYKCNFFHFSLLMSQSYSVPFRENSKLRHKIALWGTECRVRASK